jgi:diguanylate cyclase (GGDEF)-like protein
MTRWGADTSRSDRKVVPGLSNRLPGLIALGALLIVIWGAGVRILYHGWYEREAAAFSLVDDNAIQAAENVARLLNDADQALLTIRERHPDDAGFQPEHWQPAASSAGIALVKPDGEIVAASPHANTAGWPHLMALLAHSADELAIGEPVLGKNGRTGLLPVARRIVRTDGSFGGILMYSLSTDVLLHVPPGLLALDGCISLADEDGIVLARSPVLRGTVGVRIMKAPAFQVPVETRAGRGRHVSTLDGVDRMFAFHRLTGLPVTVSAAVGHEAVFADWGSLLIRVISLETLATILTFLTWLFWYARRQRTEISAAALTVVLANIENGVRVYRHDGVTVAANQAGLDLPVHNPGPIDPGPFSPGPISPGPISPGPISPGHIDDVGGAVHISRHDLSDGATVLIGTDRSKTQATEARIEFLTNHDKLTGLPNRWRAASRIRELIAGKRGSSRVAALILLDLDAFRDINDTLGNEGGDEVLIEVAGRLRVLASDHDVVARLGGDEFSLYLDEPDDEAVVTSLTRHIPRILARPIAVRGQQVRLGVSIGIAFYPRDGADAATLFRHADIALSRAKMAGRGSAQSFDPAMMVTFEEQRMVESDLRRALDGDELQLRLQPQFSCETLEVTGFEALTRWHHPTRGELSPTTFIPIAERSGLINPLGLWAIERACRAAVTWPTRHRVAVNLSPLQLRCETIQEDIRAILRRTQFPAHLLELEVTESVLLDEDQRTLGMLHKLRAMDIRITLDDFGTGYSSLSYLRRFPFDKIKIDKSFIQGQGTDRGTRVILEAMIRMCSDLGFDVVAEGVETDVQLNELKRLGCQEIQGYLLGRPLHPHMVEEFLVNHQRRPGCAPVRGDRIAAI